MRLSFCDVDERMEEFMEFFCSSKSLTKRYLALLRDLRECSEQILDDEEKLYYIMLMTHFDSAILAMEFYNELDWDGLSHCNVRHVHDVCVKFFSRKHEDYIGSHRKFLGCFHTADMKARYTAEVLVSYARTVTWRYIRYGTQADRRYGRYGTQADFFEIHNAHPNFRRIYDRMKCVKGFHTRLSRYDHLEWISRTYNFYISPEGLYIEDSSGPLIGLMYVMYGVRLGRDTGLNTQAVVDSISRWNGLHPEFYVEGDTYAGILFAMENYIMDAIVSKEDILNRWRALPERDDRVLMFDIESALCNWQKEAGKRIRKRAK